MNTIKETAGKSETSEQLKTILVADEISEEGIKVLKQQLGVVYQPDIKAGELLERIAEFDAVLVRSRTRSQPR